MIVVGYTDPWSGRTRTSTSHEYWMIMERYRWRSRGHRFEDLIRHKKTINLVRDYTNLPKHRT